MGMSELKLDLAFANKLSASPQFVSWVLGHTKFFGSSSTAGLLEDEQRRARTAAHWYKHWWCNPAAQPGHGCLAPQEAGAGIDRHERRTDLDRKSTRLNSSHLGISYAVFCLKKKT